MSRVALLLFAVIVPALPVAADELPESLDFTAIRELVVQYDGRWPPLDTVARRAVESVTGDAFLRGHDPVPLFLAWTFSPQEWASQPLITIRSAELRAELQLSLSKTVYSYTELVSHRYLLDLIGHLAHAGQGRKLDPLESKVSDINAKLLLLQSVFNGQVIRPIPDADDISGRWTAIPAAAMGGDDAVRSAWNTLREAFLSDDAAAFTAASEDLKAALAALPAATRPSPTLIATELRYNRLNPFCSGWMVMMVGAVLAAIGMMVRKRWVDLLGIIVIAVAFGIVTYGLSMRWQIAGRIPASNMYESLLFLSWGAGAFAIVIAVIMRHRFVVLTAAGMAAVSLMLADVLPMDPHVRPIVPVLMDTVWMSIHVPIIMVSYSVLALAMVVAHAQLVVMAAVPRRHDLHEAVDVAHYWFIHVGAVLLFAGIVTGSMWAASSWGRYWGWDPKEVWSLVAFLGYLAILHVRIRGETVRSWAYVVGATLAVVLFAIVVSKLTPLTGEKILAFAATALAMIVVVGLRGRFSTALKSVLCFWLIIMTYLGVNYVLGIGLHTYGFGTGAVVHYMFLVGGIDLGLILLCSVIYLARRNKQPQSAVAASAG